MSANWQKFKTEMLSYMNANKAQNSKQFAEKLANEYVKAVKSAKDIITKNSLLTYNFPALKTNFILAFTTPYINREQANIMISQFINLGIISFWTGATLTTKPLDHPPLTFTPPSMVVFPGVCTFVMPPTTDDGSSPGKDGMINNMVKAFKQHLLTVNGIVTSVTPSGVTSPLTWVGLK